VHEPRSVAAERIVLALAADGADVVVASKSFPEGKDAWDQSKRIAPIARQIVSLVIKVRKRKSQSPTKENKGGKKL
ncbi:hypothetical protein, partial [Microcoleus sp.]|uniref:hypothetical protein n=1 Tax=Microcoleus sp. TaxID=44472 RepID=UPI00403E9088